MHTAVNHELYKQNVLKSTRKIVKHCETLLKFYIKVLFCTFCNATFSK